MLLSRRVWSASRSTLSAAFDARLSVQEGEVTPALPPAFLCPALVTPRHRPKARPQHSTRTRHRARHASTSAHAAERSTYTAEAAAGPSLPARSRFLPARQEDRHQAQLILDMAQELLSSPHDQESAAMVQAMTLSLGEALRAYQKRTRAVSMRDRVGGDAISSADHLRQAFIAVALCLIHLDTRADLIKAVQLIEDAQRQLGPMPPSLVQPLLESVNAQGRYWGVLALTDLVAKQESLMMPEEILCSKLRALVSLREWTQVDCLWEDQVATRRHPPLSLHVFDLFLQVYVSNRGLLAWTVDDVLSVLRQHGHEITARQWLIILRGEERLQASAEALTSRGPIHLEARPSLEVLHEILRVEAEAHNVRGVIRILRLFHIPTGGAAVSATRPYTPLADTKTYAIVTQMLGALARPALAIRFYKLAAVLPVHSEVQAWRRQEQHRQFQHRHSRGLDLAHTSLQKMLWVPQTAGKAFREESWQLQRAALGVLRGFIWAGRPERALAFACAVMGISRSLVDGKEIHPSTFGLGLLPTVTPCAPLYSSMIQAAAHLSDRRSTPVARAILVDMYSRGIKPNQHIRRGLSHLLVHTIGSDLHGMRRVYRRLLPRSSQAAENDGISIANARRVRLFETLTSAAFPDRVLVGRPSAQRRLPPVRPEPQTHRDVRGASILPNDFERVSAPHSLHSWVIETPLGPGPDPSSWAASMPSTTLDRTQTARDVWNAIMLEGVQDEPTLQGQLEVELRTPLTRSGYALRLRVYATIRGDIASAAAIFRSMDSHGVRPTMAHVAPLIEGLCKLGRVRDADAIKRSAREHLGIAPSLRVHVALLRAHAQAGLQDAVKAELEEMRAGGHEPNEVVRNILEAASLRTARQERLAGASARSTQESHYASGARLFDPVLRVRALEQAARLSDHSVMTRFQSLLHQGAFLQAQLLVQDALAAGMQPGRDLRKAVSRSINWLDKQAQWATQHRSAAFFSGICTGAPPGSALAGEAADSKRHIAMDELERARALARVNQERVRAVHFRPARKALVARRRAVLGLLDELFEGKLMADGMQVAQQRCMDSEREHEV